MADKEKKKKKKKTPKSEGIPSRRGGVMSVLPWYKYPQPFTQDPDGIYADEPSGGVDVQSGE